MKTTLIAILATIVLRAPRRPATPESYEWVAGEITPSEPPYSNWKERFERPRK